MLTDEITSEILTKQILLFRDFLVKSWSTFDELMENHDWDDDVKFFRMIGLKLIGSF